MTDFLPAINTAGIVSALSLFLWWKSTLQKELVQPAVKPLEIEVENLKERMSKQEDLQLRLQENLENKIDKLQETIQTLTKEVAELSGQLKSRGQ